ncbi:MAG: deacetylase, partial [Epulopiscium sp.]|nr:deacetylase [Candidatus Epulonipiscium sp.]
MKIYIINQKSLLKIALAFVLVFTSMIVSKPYLHELTQTIAQKPTRKLPIYCVEREDNKISISFDAAWG